MSFGTVGKVSEITWVNGQLTNNRNRTALKIAKKIFVSKF
jgi:hypothetical protein